MFTIEEIKKNIYTKYFNVLDQSAFTVTIQSKNTEHCWHILDREYRNGSSVVILHTHKYGTEYHIQGQAPSLNQAVRQIKRHDDYHLKVRMTQKRR